MSDSESATGTSGKPRRLEWIAGALIVGGILALVLLFRLGPSGSGGSLLPLGRVPPPAAIDEILATVSPTRVVVAEYWMSNGFPPPDQQQAGLAAPEAYAGRHVQRMKVQPDGTIRVDVRDGDDAVYHVDFVPRYNPATGILLWDCRTSNPGVGARIEGCIHEGG